MAKNNSINVDVTPGGSATITFPSSSATLATLALTETLTNKTIDEATNTVGITELHGITIDGGGSAITTGVKGYLQIPFDCSITKVTMLADQSGSAVIDIWKDTYANYPPVNADSITASAPPTISSATKSEDATLTGWTTTITAGDILGFNVDSASTIERLTLVLHLKRT